MTPLTNHIADVELSIIAMYGQVSISNTFMQSNVTEASPHFGKYSIHHALDESKYFLGKPNANPT